MSNAKQQQSTKAQVSKPTKPRNARRSRKQQQQRQQQIQYLPSSDAYSLRIGPNQTRSGISPNPADPRSSLLFESLGHTALGRMDVLKILHPCGEYNMEVAKIPDGANSTTSGFERRDEYEIRPPIVGQSATTATGTGYASWSVLIVHVPFLRQRDIVIRYNSLTSPTAFELEFTLSVILSTTSDIASASEPVKAFYPEFKNMTQLGIKPSTGFVTQNFIDNTEYSILRPDVLGSDLTVTSATQSSQQLASKFFRSIRRTACGYTIDLDASSLQNEGRVISAQWSPNVEKSTVRSAANVASIEDPTKAKSVISKEEPAYELLVPPLVTTSIVQTDQYSRQALAKTGSYTPIRPSDPTFPFSPGKEVRRIVAVGPQQKDDHIVGESVFASYNEDLYLAGWSIAVDYYLNLNPAAELRMKVRECLELIPSQSSTYSSFTTPGHPNDYLAQEVLREFCRTQPHSYPADFNDMNKLFGTLIQGLGTVLGTLGVPVLSQVAPALGNAVGGYFLNRRKPAA